MPTFEGEMISTQRLEQTASFNDIDELLEEKDEK